MAPRRNEKRLTESRLGLVALVVEDDRRWASEFSRLLGQAGMSSRRAETLEQAILALGRHPPDLCVIDLWIPGSGSTDPRGMDVCKEARDLGIPVVVVSGPASMVEMRRAFKELGVADFHHKDSFDRGRFLLSVRKAVRLEKHPETAHGTDGPSMSQRVNVLVQNDIELTISPGAEAIFNLVERSPLSNRDKKRARDAVSDVYRETARPNPDRGKLQRAFSFLASHAWEVFLKVLPELAKWYKPDVTG